MGDGVYGGNLKRVKDVVNGETIYSVYDKSGALIALDNASSGKKTDYLALSGQTFVRIANGVASYPLNDIQGTAYMVADANGTISAAYNYTPFGEAIGTGPGGSNEQGYTGHREDKTGLTYMQARYYDPIIGRFLQTDPIGYKDQLNLYAYVGNDPLNKTDPTGKVIEVVGSDEFKKKVSESLARIQEGKGGKALVSKLEATKNVITIKQTSPADGNYTLSNEHNSALSDSDRESKNGGKGYGSEIGFDPNLKTGGKDANGSRERLPYVGLAHELGHSRAMDTGKQSLDRGTGDPGTTGPNEIHSMANENMVRKEHGLTEREAYYTE